MHKILGTKLLDKKKLFDSTSHSTPVALSTPVSLGTISDPGGSRSGQDKHSTRSSGSKRRTLVKVEIVKQKTQKSSANEPRKVCKTRRANSAEQ